MRLCVDVSAALIAQTITRWSPVWNAGLDRRRRLGLPPLENEHWDWLMKAGWLGLASYRSLGVECEGVMQGLMSVITDGHYARLAPEVGRPLVHVDYLQTAAWNDADLVERPRFGAIGSQLVGGAVKLSIDLGYAGRVGLHSLPASEWFYRRLGLPAVEIERQDRHARGLWYFELTTQGAGEFLQLRGQT